QVTFWLKKIYGDMPIPWYEVNERTVDILHEVMECQKERDNDVTLLIGYMKERAAKFEEEAKYWQDILEEGLGLSEHSLSEEAAADLADLVDCAMHLEIEDTSLTNFYSAINNLTSELYETKFKNDEMEVKVKSLTKKLTGALKMEQQLKEDIKKVEESQEALKAKAEVRAKNLKFLEDKSKDLKIQISDAENELVVRGLDKSLVHEALVKSSQ
ncbi:HAUS1 protein, partial [Regulus satrapa]|nr:HAUS1 protein [Regulus satrapa]